MANSQKVVPSTIYTCFLDRKRWTLKIMKWATFFPIDFNDQMTNSNFSIFHCVFSILKALPLICYVAFIHIYDLLNISPMDGSLINSTTFENMKQYVNYKWKNTTNESLSGNMVNSKNLILIMY